MVDHLCCTRPRSDSDGVLKPRASARLYEFGLVPKLKIASPVSFLTSDE